MTRSDRITETLTRTFAPLSLDVVDDSGSHAGHSGAAVGGETHFNVIMAAECFEGMTRVARARAVNDALADEFAAGLHALALTLRTPAERAKTL
ncbi:BolA family protein [Acidisoma cladoniae]|uniref:BolA family protein n=1 Tax=Acidisoma cladoniae TaxID=3040935 RepID=UPI00254AE8C8|nr:BolA family protein [Acidisoma sp. PAMC 29798]